MGEPSRTDDLERTATGRSRIVYAAGFFFALTFLVAALVFTLQNKSGERMGRLAGSRLEEILARAPVVIREPQVQWTPTAPYTRFLCEVASEADRDALMAFIEHEMGPELLLHLRISISVMPEPTQ